MNRRSFIQLLAVPLLAAACGGQSATTTTAPAATTALAPTTAPATAATRSSSPAAPAATTTRTAVAATATRAATTPAVPSAAPATRTVPAAATATRAASATAGAAPTTAAPVPFPPNGAQPAGWQTYGGNTRVPFSIYYPPDWRVDESRSSEGRVYFYAPGVREPFDDSLWALIATTGRVEATANIDALRDQYLNSDLRSGHPEAGIDITRTNQFSGLTFASLGATFDVNDQLCYAYIGLGLRGGVPWRFRFNSRYTEYSRNLDGIFAPMINSLNIYNNP